MNMSSSPKVRLPHASAGPFWSPSPAAPRHEWHEIETLLATPYEDEEPGSRTRRGYRIFAILAGVLVIGGGVLAATLLGSRGDCGADCHVVTAVAGPTGEAAPHAVATASPAPRSDATLTEGRSVADPNSGTDGAATDAVPLPHRHHHRHHHHVQN